MRLNSITTVLCLLTLTVVLCCGKKDPPFSSYEPKTHQEQAIKDALLEFQAGVNQKKAERIADLLHQDAMLMVGRERQVISRSEYVKILPKRLEENPPIYLGRARMNVADETAEVRIYSTRGGSRYLIVFQMQFVKDKWYISSWKY